MRYRQRIGEVLNRAIREVDQKKGAYIRFEAERTLGYAYESAWRFPYGYSYHNVKRLVSPISAACGAVVEMDDLDGAIVVRVIPEDLPVPLPLIKEDLRSDRLLIGYNRLRAPVYHPLNTHLLAAGASRSGKTDWLRFIVYQLWLQGYEIRICDLKGFSFFPFEPLRDITIAKSLEESYLLLNDSLQELELRKQIVQQHRSREVIKSFRPIVIIIDEAASLSPSQHTGDMKKLARECDNIISLMGQQGREPKMFMIYTTQRPDMDVINKQFKANVEASLAFRTKDDINSRIIMGRGGAERISPDTPGRCIYSYDRDHVIQVPYIGDDDAWDAMLREHLTEVLHDGQSERREKSKRVEDAIYRSAADDRSTGAINVSRCGEPDKTGFRISLPTGRGEATGVPTNRGYAEGVEAQQTWQDRSRKQLTTDSVYYGEASALVDDW